MRSWWPDATDDARGESLIENAMRFVKVSGDDVVNIAKVAQVAETIVRAMGRKPPNNDDITDIDEGVYPSPAKKKLKRFEEMNRLKTKVVYNAMGESRRVVVNVEEDGWEAVSIKKRPKSTSR